MISLHYIFGFNALGLHISKGLHLRMVVTLLAVFQVFAVLRMDAFSFSFRMMNTGNQNAA